MHSSAKAMGLPVRGDWSAGMSGERQPSASRKVRFSPQEVHGGYRQTYLDGRKGKCWTAPPVRLIVVLVESCMPSTESY